MSDEFLFDKRLVRRSFDQAAATYDTVAVLQREVSDRMLERLQYIKAAPHTLLDAGSGTGYGTRQLLQHYPKADIVALDLAPAMLKFARAHTPRWKRHLPWLSTRDYAVCGDVEALPLKSQAVDMVWSNLTVQWCNDLPATFVEMHRVLKTEGLLMFSTFGPDTLKELRAAFHDADGYNHINRFADMHDIGDMLVAAGFAEPVMDMEYITLTYDDVKAVMQDLRRIGAHNATAGRAQGMMGKGAWNKVVENYERLRRDGKLPATYEVVYGHAWKGEKKQPPGDPQVIRFAKK